MRPAGFDSARIRAAASRPEAPLALARGGAAALSFAWLVVAARLLSRQEFSDLAIILAIGAVLTVMADAGYVVTLNHLVAEAGQIPKGLLTQVERRRLALAAVASVIIAGAYFAVARDRSLEIPAIYSVSVLSTAIYTTGTAALRGLGLVRIEAINEIASRAAILIVGTTWLVLHPSLMAAVTAYSACDLGSAVIVAITARHHEVEEQPLPPPSALAFRRVAPLAASALLGNLYNKVDLWILAGLGTTPAVALYAACYRVHEGTLILSGAQSALALRRMAVAGTSNIVAVLRRLMLEAAILAAAPALALGLAAPILLEATFGHAFVAGSGILRVLMLASAPLAIVAVLAPYCAVNRRYALATWVGVALAVNVLINLMTIPAYGGLGAAWATVASSVLLAGATVRLAFRIARSSAPELS